MGKITIEMINLHESCVAKLEQNCGQVRYQLRCGARLYSFNPCPAEYIKMPRPLQIFSQSDYLIQIIDVIHILNCKQCRSRSVGFLEANWSGSTLFANAGYIRVQQDKG